MGCTHSSAANAVMEFSPSILKKNTLRTESERSVPTTSGTVSSSRLKPGEFVYAVHEIEEEHEHESKTQQPPDERNNKKENPNKPIPESFPEQAQPSITIRTVKDTRTNYAVRRGYSSGASSFSSDLELDLLDGSENNQNNHNNSSNHSSDCCGLPTEQSQQSRILDLLSLRQEMVADGDLTQTVVRIESPYGQKIEEVYEGVRDGTVLGSGVSGTVRLVTHRTTKVQYAVKIFEFDQIGSDEGLRQLREEIFIMCQLDHPNIVRIEEVYESSEEIFIVQELCRGGDLFDRLDKTPDWHWTESQCAKLVKQMLSAIRYLHSRGITHRDLKLESFLFSCEDSDSDLRMIDFGLSKHFVAGQHLNEPVGTPYTVAPEIIEGHYDEKCDIWALGVITYLILSGEAPFGGIEGEHPRLVKENIQRARPLFEPKDVWETVSDDAVAFVKRLLQSKPELRPTAKETQKDNWIQVWAKKDVSTCTRINPKTIHALMEFKEKSDMQKLLSEVLSFTLLPEQIVELRAAFQKMDTEGTGEISLNAMKMVLLQNAEAGSLGGLTDSEIESLFDSIRVRKCDTTIHWHEFLAAGLSLAKIDDRNLRLAFDRMDTQRKGYITLQDLQDMLGKCAESKNLELVWLDSLQELQASENNRIDYDDFKRLMKGQSNPRNDLQSSGVFYLPCPAAADTTNKSLMDDRDEMNDGDPRASFRRSKLEREGSSCRFELPEGSRDLLDSMTPLEANRTLYRLNRERRSSLLEASRQYRSYYTPQQREEILTEPFIKQERLTAASLIMKRGLTPMVVKLNQSERNIKIMPTFSDSSILLPDRSPSQRSKSCSESLTSGSPIATTA